MNGWRVGGLDGSVRGGVWLRCYWMRATDTRAPTSVSKAVNAVPRLLVEWLTSARPESAEAAHVVGSRSLKWFLPWSHGRRWTGGSGCQPRVDGGHSELELAAAIGLGGWGGGMGWSGWRSLGPIAMEQPELRMRRRGGQVGDQCASG